MSDTNVIIVSVVDSFEIKVNTPGSDHAPGVVVVFDGRQCAFLLPTIGSRVELLRPDGSTRRTTVDEIKEHGDGRSFFFAGLTRADAPIGTIVTWSDPSVSGVARVRHQAAV
jgi:hypothetical protein